MSQSFWARRIFLLDSYVSYAYDASNAMKHTKKRPYKSLQDWMERTRSNQTKLAALTGIGQPILSRILTGGQRCSLENALKLNEVTGVPVEKLTTWKRRNASPASSEPAVKSDLRPR